MSLDDLRGQILAPGNGAFRGEHYMALGFRESYGESMPVARARALEALLLRSERFLYDGDLIAGSMRALFHPLGEAQCVHDKSVCDSFGKNGFRTNCDHFAPDYETLLREGIGGLLARVERSRAAHTAEKQRNLLDGMEISLRALSSLALAYALDAEARGFFDMADTLRAVSMNAPRTFRQALQLVWLVHLTLCLEGRYAMALGRLDQYLYPFYERDTQNGTLTREGALDLVECALVKILERRLFGGDDVVNIAIGGVQRDGSDALNELSYAILEAVGHINTPGPNLSARIHTGTPDRFLDAALKVIGTGLGYPALMNDEINIPALARYGYALEDSRDYCMVGCIENFLPGMQPPWSDGRFNVPKYLELALNRGVCMLTGVQIGPDTGDPAAFTDMGDLTRAFDEQLTFGAAEYVSRFKNDNERYNRERLCQPYLSCFCQDCIDRALDINDGGARYPSVHGVGCMGVGTVTDSLAAIERVVFQEKRATMSELIEALKTNFADAPRLRALLESAPKYGNGDDAADKYAVWYVKRMDELFSRYKTWDGGGFYVAMAANVSNIYDGQAVAATPDGRLARTPLSDAASPTYGRDKNGPTAVIESVTKPDYTKVACGTVLNQKYSPDAFSNERRSALVALVKTYFERGGQEIQINAVSRRVLSDAMAHPEQYASLVVRVSGFSAYYTRLDKRVQEDILSRTEHE